MQTLFRTDGHVTRLISSVQICFCLLKSYERSKYCVTVQSFYLNRFDIGPNDRYGKRHKMKCLSLQEISVF